MLPSAQSPDKTASGTVEDCRESRHPSFCHGLPHPLIRGSQVRRKTTASGQVEHAEGEYPTLDKRWASDIPDPLYRGTPGRGHGGLR